MLQDYAIVLATSDDIAGMLDLQERNLPYRGGTLSVRLSEAWFETAIAAMPVIVARRDEKVVGYLVSSPVTAYAKVSVVQAMLHAYPGGRSSYVYGPICVDERERGRGVAGAMFETLKARLPGREGILFIRQDNEASLRAHAKMGIRQAAIFEHAGIKFVALSYIG
jgi:L-amino acid N-acyltransferase YncA